MSLGDVLRVLDETEWVGEPDEIVDVGHRFRERNAPPGASRADLASFVTIRSDAYPQLEASTARAASSGRGCLSGKRERALAPAAGFLPCCVASRFAASSLSRTLRWSRLASPSSSGRTAGKSNLLDAFQMLARTATERTLADALAPPIRGFPQEAFTFPSGGLPELLAQPSAQFSLEADLQLEPEGRREERVR